MASAQALLRPLERHGIRLGLDAFQALLHRLGNPHLRFPSVLVAGTNGKGSCAAFLASALGAAGYRAGLYTSPHLEEIGERVRIDGRAAADGDLAAALQEVLDAARPEPTWFEAVTATALLLFARSGVDVAILEVGLGGRLDATNAADSLVSVIAPIAMDHEKHLGSTLGAIAREKAGVLRAGRSAAVWVAEPPVRAALEQHAEALGARLRRLPDEARLEPATAGPSGLPRASLVTSRSPYMLECPLAGAHQLGNLALAVVAAEELAVEGFSRLTPEAVEKGARGCRWPGRLEEVILPDGRRVLLDGAHNPAAAACLATHLESRPEPWDLLFGALEDKDAGAMLGALTPEAGRVILTSPPGHRSHLPARLATLLPGSETIVEETLETALDRALGRDGPLLVITGSLYLVGAARQELRRRYGIPQAAVDIAIWQRTLPAEQRAPASPSAG
jgi:dihydrofolate synthase / folylpolyglutamate synthase